MLEKEYNLLPNHTPLMEFLFREYESDFPIFFDIYTLIRASYAEGIIIHPKVTGSPLEFFPAVWQINV